MSERSGIHLNAGDSGWPVAAAAEAYPHKDGTGTDDASLPRATAVEDGVVTAETGVQVITLAGGDAGTEFILTLDDEATDPIALDAIGADVQGALEANDNVAPGDLEVTGVAGGPYRIIYLEDGDWGDALPEITADPVGVDAVQTLTVDATEGDYTILTENDETTAIAEDAADSAVEAAIVATDDFAADDVVVEGDAGGPYTITFADEYAERAVPLLTTDDAGLEGGTAVITEETAGKTGPTVTITTPVEGG